MADKPPATNRDGEGGPVVLDLADETATAAFAEDIAAVLARGDVIALSGGLGAGKTTFARALIRAVADDPALEVPSPTFTLVQTYAGRLPVAHFDLYRLGDPVELAELGLDEARDGVAVLEWPERAGAMLPADRLDIALSVTGTGRRAEISAGRSWRERLPRTLARRRFLDHSGFSAAVRRHLQGDASTRTYERISAAERDAILMDWPPPGPGAPDTRAAYRARDVRAFIAIDEALGDAGLSVPAIYAADVASGFLLLENFGREGILREGRPDVDRYAAAIDVLAAIHARPRPVELPYAGGVHRVPAYSLDAMAVEVDFFPDWYMPHVTGGPLDPLAKREFQTIWRDLVGRLASAEKTWVLLDYHSPNLLWLPDRSGLQRVGLLDFQDMLIGPTAYDVASLAQDARVTVPAETEDILRNRYAAARRAGDPHFDADAFATAYAILAAQRATKIIGVFARLADHLGRRDYLAHMPRLREYLTRSLAHPVLSGYALWHARHVPPAA